MSCVMKSPNRFGSRQRYARPTVSCLPTSARSRTLIMIHRGFSTERSNDSSPVHLLPSVPVPLLEREESR